MHRWLEPLYLHVVGLRRAIKTSFPLFSCVNTSKLKKIVYIKDRFMLHMKKIRIIKNYQTLLRIEVLNTYTHTYIKTFGSNIVLSIIFLKKNSFETSLLVNQVSIHSINMNSVR